MEGDGTCRTRWVFSTKTATKRQRSHLFVECCKAIFRDPGQRRTPQILVSGDCDLPKTIPNPSVSGQEKCAAQNGESRERKSLSASSQRVRARSRAVGDVRDTPVSADEIRAGEILVRSFLGDDSRARLMGVASPSGGGPPPTQPTTSTKMKTKPVAIAIRLVHGRIEETTAADAIAVGHYVGVAPQYAELAIDQAISKTRGGKKRAKARDEKLIITDLCKRGVIVGQLAQNFILPDPRKRERVIVIAGMGRPGTFGEAELTVLAREPSDLGPQRAKNLASVVIGAGREFGSPDAVAPCACVRRPCPTLKRRRTVAHHHVVEYRAGNSCGCITRRAARSFRQGSETPLKIDFADTRRCIGSCQTNRQRKKPRPTPKSKRKILRRSKR